MLDGRQRAGRIARCRIRAALQSVPAHETDHAAQDSRQPRLSQGGGRDRPRHRGQSAPGGRANGESEGLTAGMASSLLCPDAFLSPLEIDAVVTRALAEDLGRAGDVTSVATIPADASARAVVVARKAGVLSGLPLVAGAFRKLAPEIKITAHMRDGMK